MNGYKDMRQEIEQLQHGRSRSEALRCIDQARLWYENAVRESQGDSLLKYGKPELQ